VQDLQQVCAGLEIRCRRANRQAERAKAVLSGLVDPVIVIDELDEVVLANPAARELLQIDAEKTEGRALARLVRCQKLVELLVAACHRESSRDRSEELELVDPRGQSRWYRVRATRLAPAGDKESEPEYQGAVAVLRDVGDQKALQKRNAEFVSAVSHEMKAPLAGIKAYVELLADGDAEDEETREEFLSVINSQADRLQRLVDNMLNLARIEAGVVAVNKEHRSLNELLEEAAHVVQPAAESKGIELATCLSPLYLGVFADRDMLLQAAINLLSNAVKYTPAGGRVTLRSRLDGEQVEFEVEDTGVGLSEEDCRRVFERFYRVKKDKDMASGTGLGLPLAKHIVEDVHGGELTVRSIPGTGSTFRVVLPSSKRLS
jgi:two-component system phosphate regulon sensor histidine kinase PhoR